MGCSQSYQLRWGRRYEKVVGLDHVSGQIIATSHDLTPNGGLVREIPLISGKSRLVKYYNLARCIFIYDLLPFIKRCNSSLLKIYCFGQKPKGNMELFFFKHRLLSGCELLVLRSVFVTLIYMDCLHFAYTLSIPAMYRHISHREILVCITSIGI